MNLLFTCHTSTWYHDLSWHRYESFWYTHSCYACELPSRTIEYDTPCAPGHHETLYTDPKKETSALHLCLLLPNECSYFIQLFCFNNVDHLATLYTKPKSIWWSLASITTTQALVPKFHSHKINKSCELHFPCISLSHWTDTLLSYYECQVYSLLSRLLA